MPRTQIMVISAYLSCLNVAPNTRVKVDPFIRKRIVVMMDTINNAVPIAANMSKAKTAL